MSLVTKKRLARHAWTVIPITAAVIATIEHMAEVERQPLIEGGVPVFELVRNVLMGDLPIDNDSIADDRTVFEHNTIINGEDIDDTDYDNLPVDIHINNAPNVENIVLDAIPEDADNFDDLNDFPIEDAVDKQDDTDKIEGVVPLQVEEHIEIEERTIDDVEIEERLIDDAEIEERIIDEVDIEERPVEESAPHYNLRPARDRNYNHLFSHSFLQQAVENCANNRKDAYTYITEFIFTQMTAKAGIKKHGDKAVDALMAEFSQLERKNVFEAIDASTLTVEQKKAALRAINLIKEKRCGKLKGRACADGSKQRQHYAKEDTTSPTMATDALMLTLMVDAKEKRNVATADVEGAYERLCYHASHRGDC